MVLPLIPILAVIGILGGGVTLAWYELLSDDEKDKANYFASQYALEVFGKTISELTKEEVRVVEQLTQRHFR
jgi:predicted metal-dependent RNase